MQDSMPVTTAVPFPFSPNACPAVPPVSVPSPFEADPDRRARLHEELFYPCHPSALLVQQGGSPLTERRSLRREDLLRHLGECIWTPLASCFLPFDGSGAEGPTAVVSSASSVEHSCSGP